MSATCHNPTCPCTQPDRSAAVETAEEQAQREQWEAHIAKEHGKGRCEFSGLLVTSCVRSICDCFETEEGASAIVRASRRAGSS